MTESFLRELRTVAQKYADTHAIAYVVVPDDKEESACFEGNTCMVCVRDGYNGLIRDKGLEHGHAVIDEVPIGRIH